MSIPPQCLLCAPKTTFLKLYSRGCIIYELEGVIFPETSRFELRIATRINNFGEGERKKRGRSSIRKVVMLSEQNNHPILSNSQHQIHKDVVLFSKLPPPTCSSSSASQCSKLPLVIAPASVLARISFHSLQLGRRAGGTNLGDFIVQQPVSQMLASMPNETCTTTENLEKSV
jgi:hypothetical protein